MKMFRFQKLVAKLEILFLLLCLLVVNHGSVSTANALSGSMSMISSNAAASTLQQNDGINRSVNYETLSAIGLQANTWTQIGLPIPNSLAISPNYAADGKVFIANWGQQKVYISSNWGQDWQSLAGVVGNNVDGIAVSPNFLGDATLFATSSGYATYYGGVIRSKDGGITWSPVLYKAMDVLAISPAYAADQTVLAGSSTNGIYRSTDGGNTWSQVYTGGSKELHFSPAYNSDHTIFSVYGGKIIRSNDGGANWTDLYMHGVSIYLALSPDFAGDQTMYFATSPSGTSASAVYRSTNGGITWSLRSSMPASAQARVIRVSPDYANDGAVFVVATNGFYRSIDQASTWTKTINRSYIGGYSGFVFSPAYATDGTIFTLINGGLVKSTDRGVTWQTRLPGDNLTSILRTPNNELLVTLFNAHPNSGGVLRSVDDGITWTVTGADVVLKPYSSVVSPTYTSDHTLFFGQASTPRIFRSTDSGSTWSSATLGTTGTVWVIGASPDFANDHTVFAGIVQPAQGESFLYRSTDGGQTWQSSSLTDPSAFSNAGVYSIAFSPNYRNDHTLFAGTSSGLFKSTNQGDSWLATPASETVRTIAVSPNYASDHTLFVGVDRRILRSENNGDTWQVVLQDNLNPGMSTDFYNRIILSPNFSADGMIFATKASQTVWSKSAGACWDQLGTYGSTNGSLTMDADNGITLFKGNSDVVLGFALNPATVSPVGNMSGSLIATSPAPIDGVTPSNITVTLQDANCNPVAGQRVTLSSSRGSVDTFSYLASTTNASGKLAATVTSITTGSATITARLGYSNINMNGQAVVEFRDMPTNYPIILLPGIMGSRLTNTTSCSKRPSGEIWIQRIFADKLNPIAVNVDFNTLLLKIDSNGNPQSNNGCDSISATGIMDSDSFNYYGSMRDTLVQAGYTVVDFPYDWRLSLESNAEKLDQKINALNVSKVILLGHSMGGLLARQYVSTPTWAAKVAKVITLGSPYWGAPALARAMRAGKTGMPETDDFLPHLVVGNSIKNLILNSPGSMELLPSRAYLAQFGPYYNINGQSLTNYDDTLNYFKDHGQNPILLDKADTFHVSLDDFRSSNLNGVSYFVLAANQKITPSIVSENSCGLFGSSTCYDIPNYSRGDGTVPWVSARLSGNAGDWKGTASVCTMSQVNSDHSGLMKDPIAQGLVLKILNDQPLAPTDCEETQAAAGSQALGSLAAIPTAFIEVTVQSSGRVSVTDAANHTASVGGDGIIMNDIPSATFEVIGEMTTITLPVTSTYTITLHQTNTSPGKIRVTDFRTLVDSETFDPYQRAVFVDVPSTAGGIVTMSVDYTSGMSSLQLLLDQDGNGSIDQTLPPTSVLDQIQSRDYTAPQATINITGTPGYGWYVGDITVTITAEDNPGGTGVDKIDYSLDGGKTILEYSGSFSLDASSHHRIMARSTDLAGNSSWQSVVAPMKTVSGNTGAPGVLLTYMVDGVLKTVLSDQKGNYMLEVPSGWSGTITPSKQCGGRNSLTRCYFFPAQKTYANISVDKIKQNYILKRAY